MDVQVLYGHRADIDAVIEGAEKELLKRVRQIETRLHGDLVERIARMALDTEGAFKSAVDNLRVLGELDDIVRASAGEELANLNKFIVSEIETVLAGNQAYFRALKLRNKVVESRARKEILKRIGYDTVKGEVIEGGFLSRAANPTQLVQQLGAQIDQAITARIPMKDFLAQFRTAFTSNSQGMGMLERHYRTYVFDTFQRTDRSTAKIYASEYDLNHAIYSGTLVKRSRAWCRRHVDKVFHRDEIAAWKDKDWAGKPSIYDPFTDCGGFNCRHTWDWISEELALELGWTKK